jgi:hypothetical protein
MATRAGSSLCAARRGQDGALRTTLPVRDALCPGRESSFLRRLLLGLELCRGFSLSMSYGEALRGRFSGRGAVLTGDFGRVGGRGGDAGSAGLGEARS